MESWVQGIITGDLEWREKEPDIIEGCYYSDAYSLLFHSITAQLEIAKQSGDAKVTRDLDNISDI